MPYSPETNRKRSLETLYEEGMSEDSSLLQPNRPPNAEDSSPSTTELHMEEGTLAPAEFDSRYLCDKSYQYKPTLIQYEDTEQCTDFNFGLIRGYHREMHEPPDKKCACCPCCVGHRMHWPNRIRVRNRVFTVQVFGVLIGAVLVFTGLVTLLIGCTVLSDEAREYFWTSLKVPSQYIHGLALLGLIFLSLGTALVSMFLLVPLCMKDIPTVQGGGLHYSCTAGDLYVKDAEQTYNFSTNRFLYFDADFYRKLFGPGKVRKVQPELTSGEESK